MICLTNKSAHDLQIADQNLILSIAESFLSLTKMDCCLDKNIFQHWVWSFYSGCTQQIKPFLTVSLRDTHLKEVILPVGLLFPKVEEVATRLAYLLVFVEAILDNRRQLGFALGQLKDE